MLACAVWSVKDPPLPTAMAPTDPVLHSFLGCCTLYQGCLIIGWIFLTINLAGLICLDTRLTHLWVGGNPEGTDELFLFLGILCLLGAIMAIMLFIGLLRNSWKCLVMWVGMTVILSLAQLAHSTSWCVRFCLQLRCKLGATLVIFTVCCILLAVYAVLVVYSYYALLRFGPSAVAAEPPRPARQPRGSVMRQPEEWLDKQELRRSLATKRLTAYALAILERPPPDHATTRESDARLEERARMQEAKRQQAGRHARRRTTHARQKGALLGTFLCCCGLRQGTLIMGWLLLSATLRLAHAQFIHIGGVLMLDAPIGRYMLREERLGADELFLYVGVLSLFGSLACITLLVGIVKDEPICLKVWLWVFSFIAALIIGSSVYWILSFCPGLKCQMGSGVVAFLVVYGVLVVYALMVVASCYKVFVYHSVMDSAAVRQAVKEGPPAAAAE